MRVAQVPLELAQSEARERRRRSRDRKARERKSTSEQDDAAKEPTSDDANSDAKTRTSKDVKSEKRTRSRAEESKPDASEASEGDEKSAPSPRTAVPAPIPVPNTAAELLPKPDVWTDQEIIGALQECLKDIGPAVAEIEAADPVRNGQCGAPAPVMVRRLGAGPGVEVRPPAMINCPMVARLHEWMEQVVQPAARDVLGAPVAAITHLSGYDCRFRNNALAGMLSEHGHANALDIGGFVMADKRKVEVLGDWGPTVRDLAAQSQLEPASVRPKNRIAPKVARLSRTEVEEIDDAAEPVAEDSSRRQRKKSRRQIARAEEALARQAEAGRPDGEPAAAARRGRDRARQETRDDGARDQPTGEERAKAAVPVPEAPPVAENARPLATTPERTFLSRVHDGACGIFTTVLGPEANEAHRNHFHFDLAPRKRKAFCE